MLFKQVQMTAAATKGTTVWVYRCSIYAYPWYTSVRAILDDPAYSDWFVKFKPEGPWYSPKCDHNFTPPKCSDNYHMQEQSPGFPHGDGDCAAPGPSRAGADRDNRTPRTLPCPVSHWQCCLDRASLNCKKSECGQSCQIPGVLVYLALVCV